MRILLVASVLWLAACKKTEVDPAYMSQIADAAASLCKCVTLPKASQVACMGDVQKAGTTSPKKTPNGDPPGIYEEKLDDASKSKIEAARKQWASCEAEIVKP